MKRCPACTIPNSKSLTGHCRRGKVFWHCEYKRIDGLENNEGNEGTSPFIPSDEMQSGGPVGTGNSGEVPINIVNANVLPATLHVSPNLNLDLASSLPANINIV